MLGEGLPEIAAEYGIEWAIIMALIAVVVVQYRQNNELQKEIRTTLRESLAAVATVKDVMQVIKGAGGD